MANTSRAAIMSVNLFCKNRVNYDADSRHILVIVIVIVNKT